MTDLNDIISAMFTYLGPKQEFDADDSKIHRAFYRMSNEDRFKNILDREELAFSIGGDYPISSVLKSHLQNLNQSRQLQVIGPDLKKYQISDELFNHYTRKGKEILTGDYAAVCIASERFRELVDVIL